MFGKLSREAYDHLPRLEISDLRYGDVINITPGKPKWYDPLRVVYWFIYHQQVRRYGKPKVTAVHTWWHSWEGRIFETAPPRCRHAIIKSLDRLDPDCWYIVCRYKDWQIKTGEEREIIWHAMEELVGQSYDYGQILAILVNEILQWPPAEYLSIFDLGRLRKVCSVLVRTLWLSWYEQYAKPHGLNVRRPGGDLHVERTDPALLENHPTFEVVGVLNAGAARRKPAPLLNLKLAYA